MINETDPNVIGITQPLANTDASDAELGISGYAMFQKVGMRHGGSGVILYFKKFIQVVQVHMHLSVCVFLYSLPLVFFLKHSITAWNRQQNFSTQDQASFTDIFSLYLAVFQQIAYNLE